MRHLILIAAALLFGFQASAQNGGSTAPTGAAPAGTETAETTANLSAATAGKNTAAGGEFSDPMFKGLEIDPVTLEVRKDGRLLGHLVRGQDGRIVRGENGVPMIIPYEEEEPETAEPVATSGTVTAWGSANRGGYVGRHFTRIDKGSEINNPTGRALIVNDGNEATTAVLDAFVKVNEGHSKQFGGSGDRANCGPLELNPETAMILKDLFAAAQQGESAVSRLERVALNSNLTGADAVDAMDRIRRANIDRSSSEERYTDLIRMLINRSAVCGKNAPKVQVTAGAGKPTMSLDEFMLRENARGDGSAPADNPAGSAPAG